MDGRSKARAIRWAVSQRCGMKMRSGGSNFLCNKLLKPPPAKFWVRAAWGSGSRVARRAIESGHRAVP